MAITLTFTHKVTDDELRELSARNPGYQFERNAKGDLVVTPTSGRSAYREAKLVSQIDRWAERGGLGIVLSPTAGFRLPNGEFYVPDAAWVRHEHWEALGPDAQDEVLYLCRTPRLRSGQRPADLPSFRRRCAPTSPMVFSSRSSSTRTFSPGRSIVNKPRFGMLCDMRRWINQWRALGPSDYRSRGMT